MAHQWATNYQLVASNNVWSAIWKLTRVMKKAGWRYLGSSDGTSKDTTGNSSSDLWGGGVSTGNTGSTASITTTNGQDVNVTGLTGITTASVGNFLTITGAASAANNGTFQIVEYVSANAVRVRNASAVANDANNGAITWTEKDPALDTYQTSWQGASAWWAAQGPDTLKIPIGAAATGTFLRGEKVLQSATAAEGEILGYVFNTASDSFIVVMPRFGTFNGSNVITGVSSGATVTPTGTPNVFVEEVVFWKAADQVSGTIYSQRVDASSESAERFSSRLTAAGCTATVAPGGGGTGNGFPTFAYVARGTGGSVTHAPWLCQTTAIYGQSRAQITATNCINVSGTSADGTFWIVVGVPFTSATASAGFAHFRVDDQEDGDVDPFVWLVPWTTTLSRTSNPNATGTNDFWSTNSNMYNPTQSRFIGWRRRGFGTDDVFRNDFFFAALFNYNATSSNIYLCSNPTTVDRVACHPGSITVREPVWALSNSTLGKQRKGTIRWLQLVGTGSAYDTWANKTWLQVCTCTGTVPFPGYILGPWDGVTTPLQA